MTLTIEVPEDVAARLRERAEATGQDVNAFAIAVLAAVAAAEELEDPEAIREIGEALAEMHAAQARGDHGLTVEETFSELEQRAQERAHRRRTAASATAAA